MDIIKASKSRDGQLDHTFKSSSRYKDDVLSLKNLFSAHICILSIHMTLKQRIQPTLKSMFLLRSLPLHPNRRNIFKQNFTRHVMISLFQLSMSHSYAAIFQNHERMRLTFHNSSVMLGVVPNTVLF